MFIKFTKWVKSFALKSFYTYKEKYPKLEVVDYEIISFSPSKVVVDGLEDNEYYNVLISLEFNRRSWRDFKKC